MVAIGMTGFSLVDAIKWDRKVAPAVAPAVVLLGGLLGFLGGLLGAP